MIQPTPILKTHTTCPDHGQDILDRYYQQGLKALRRYQKDQPIERK